jgi:hypothetical protein
MVTGTGATYAMGPGTPPGAYDPYGATQRVGTPPGGYPPYGQDGRTALVGPGTMAGAPVAEEQAGGRKRWPIVVAIVAALLVAAGVGAYALLGNSTAQLPAPVPTVAPPPAPTSTTTTTEEETRRTTRRTTTEQATTTQAPPPPVTTTQAPPPTTQQQPTTTPPTTTTSVPQNQLGGGGLFGGGTGGTPNQFGNDGQRRQPGTAGG